MEKDINTHYFDPLYNLDNHGKLRIWQISVTKNADGTAVINTKTGQDGGKMTTTRRVIATGKNIGKKNETTPFEQALSEAQSKHEKKLKEGMTKDRKNVSDHGSGTTSMIFPMLAEKWTSHSAKIKYPAIVQPKLDGVRCIAHRDKESGQVILKTRTNHSFPHLEHIIAELQNNWVFGNAYLDGEIYLPKMGFQKLSGLCRAVTLTAEERAEMETLEYHIFDGFWLDDLPMAFSDRYENISALYSEHNWTNIKLVDCQIVDSEKEVMQKHEIYKVPFEGTMIRNMAGPYKLDGRSTNLLKLKDFVDDEYEIVGFSQAKGNDAGTVIWKCTTSDGKKFDVKPQGTREYRRELFENAENYIGKMLTVKYQETTDDGAPRFGTGIAIRDYE